MLKNTIPFVVFGFSPQPFKRSILSSQNIQKELESQIQPAAIVCCPAVEMEKKLEFH